MKVVGLDIGFGHTKAFSDKGQLKFPSWIAYWTFAGLGDIKPIEYQGSNYVVGDQAKLSGRRVELASIDELIKYYPVFIKYTLDTLGLVAKDVLIVTGLPPRYMDRSEELKKDKIGVKRIIVFQGFGIYWDVKDKHELSSGLVLDIGFNTVDYFAFTLEGGNFTKEMAGTISSLGVINAVGIFRDMLPSKYEMLKNKPLSGLINIFVDGKYRGTDFSQIKAQAIEHWNEMIKARLRQELGILFEEKQELVVAGGGAYLIKPDVFPQEVIIPEQPEFSNARGYYKLGLGV